jgi:hypothetical protein
MPKGTAARVSKRVVLTDDTACLRNTGALQSCIPEGMGGGGVGGILAAVLSWFSPLAQTSAVELGPERLKEPKYHNFIELCFIFIFYQLIRREGVDPNQLIFIMNRRSICPRI